MSAQTWQILGVVLLIAGAALLLISQPLLARWHKKINSGM